MAVFLLCGFSLYLPNGIFGRKGFYLEKIQFIFFFLVSCLRMCAMLCFRSFIFVAAHFCLWCMCSFLCKGPMFVYECAMSPASPVEKTSPWHEHNVRVISWIFAVLQVYMFILMSAPTALLWLQYFYSKFGNQCHPFSVLFSFRIVLAILGPSSYLLWPTCPFPLPL